MSCIINFAGERGTLEKFAAVGHVIKIIQPVSPVLGPACFGGCPIHVEQDLSLIVIGIEQLGNAYLFEVAHAVCGTSAFTGFAEGGEQHAGENGDDGNDYE